MRGRLILAVAAIAAITIVYAADGAWLVVAAWLVPLCQFAYYLGRHSERKLHEQEVE